MPEEKQRPLKVFLSYASQDRPAVRELSQRLAREGWINPWVDEKKLLPGQDWRLKIEEAVETSDAVIICLSNRSVTKEGYVQKELRYAREIALEKPEENIFLIPLRLDECEVPRGLRFYQWVDYFGEMKDEAYKALIASLNLRYKQKLRVEEAELARQEKEKREREAAERVAREKAEQEAKEKAAQEKAEREAAKKAACEKAEREAEKKALREKEKREAAEKTKRERAERKAARKAALSENFSRAVSLLKSHVTKAVPTLRVMGILGVIAILVWGASLAVPKFLSLIPTVEPSATITLTPNKRPTSTATFTPSLTKTFTPIPTITSTPTLTPIPQGNILLQEDFEDGEATGWRISRGSWIVKEETNGNHYWEATGPANYPQVWYGDDLGWSDYVFESRIKFVNDGEIFICFYASGGGSFYSMFLNNSSLNFVHFNPSKNVDWAVQETISKRFSKNKWYLIRIEIENTLLNVYIDDLLTLSRELSTPLVKEEGGIGYYLGLNDDKFYIDDIRVWKLR